MKCGYCEKELEGKSHIVHSMAFCSPECAHDYYNPDDPL